MQGATSASSVKTVDSLRLFCSGSWLVPAFLNPTDMIFECINHNLVFFSWLVIGYVVGGKKYQETVIYARVCFKNSPKGQLKCLSAGILSRSEYNAFIVFRVAVNGSAALASAGLASGLNPTATLVTDYFARSYVGDNVDPA